MAATHHHLPRRTILSACCLGMSTACFFTVAPATCLTAIAHDLGMGQTMKGSFLGAGLWGLTLATLASGAIAARSGFRLLMVASALLQFLGLLIISAADDWSLAVTGAFTAGVGRGLISPLIATVVCAVYPNRRTQVTNLMQAFYPVGLIMTVAMILALWHVDWTWRPIFRLLAVIVLPCCMAVAFLPLPQPTHEGGASFPSRRILRHGIFTLLLMGLFLGGMTEVGPSTWLPDFVEETAGGSRTQGGLGLILFGFTMALGRFAASGMVRRLGARGVCTISGAVCAVSVMLAAASGGAVLTVCWLAVLGFGVAGLYPTMLAYGGDRFPQGGASMYAVLCAAACLGAMIGPVMIGLAAEWIGLRPAMALLAIAPVLLLVLAPRMNTVPSGAAQRAESVM